MLVEKEDFKVIWSLIEPCADQVVLRSFGQPGIDDRLSL